MADDRKSPVLQKYFENDPPSFFDQLKNNSAGPQTMSALPDMGLPFDDFNPMVEEKYPVSEEVRNMWECPQTDDSKPPSLTLPLISFTNDMPDPILQSVLINCPEESKNRKSLSSNEVTQDAAGLRKLIEEGCLRSAINLTGRLLAVYGYDGKTISKHTPHSLQLWFTRLSLLLKIGEYEACCLEAEPFDKLEKPDIFHDYKDQQIYKSKKGSMACFSFRLLLAILPMYSNKTKLAINNLINLLEVTKKIRIFFEKQEKTNEFEFWKQREILIMHHLINCSLFLKNFDLTHQLFEEILKLPNLSDDDKFTHYSAWGRIYLQCGDIQSAEKMFTNARKFNKNPKFIQNDLIDRGLLAISQNDFQEGFNHFQKALDLEDKKDNVLILNNMAVCHLYNGKLSEAVKIYEKTIQDFPKKINEHILLNLSTLYELQSSVSKTKKVELLKIVSQNRGDLYVNLDSCLKL